MAEDGMSENAQSTLGSELSFMARDDGLDEVRPEDSISMVGMQRDSMSMVGSQAQGHGSSPLMRRGQLARGMAAVPMPAGQALLPPHLAPPVAVGALGEMGSLLFKLKDPNGTMHRIRCERHQQQR